VGAGMQDDYRGCAPLEIRLAAGVPLDCSRGRDRSERFFSTGRGVGRGVGGGAAFACFWGAGFAGFGSGFFGAAAAFFATLRTAAFARDARATTFLMMRLRVPREAFFLCAFTIVKKEWRSIAVSRFPVEGFRANARRWP